MFFGRFYGALVLRVGPWTKASENVAFRSGNATVGSPKVSFGATKMSGNVANLLPWRWVFWCKCVMFLADREEIWCCGWTVGQRKVDNVTVESP